MAKTRAQARKNTATQSKLAQSLKKKTVKKNTLKKNTATIVCGVVLKECFIRLERVNLKAMMQSIKKEEVKSYNLRIKNTCATKKIVQPRSLNQIVAISQAALYTSKAIRIWDEVKKRHLKATLSIDQIVCARMSGHRPWPAKISKFQKNGTQLFFYGTDETGTVKRAEIVPYFSCKDVIDEYLKVPISDLSSKTLHYHMKFVKAVREVGGI